MVLSRCEKVLVTFDDVVLGDDLARGGLALSCSSLVHKGRASFLLLCSPGTLRNVQALARRLGEVDVGVYLFL